MNFLRFSNFQNFAVISILKDELMLLNIVKYPRLISFRSLHSSTVGQLEGKTSFL